MLQETDFRLEGHNAVTLKRNFENFSWVKIPHVYWEYTTAKVLTLEFIDGTRLDELGKLDELGVDRKIVALNGCNAILKQVFIDGFFHADPHPANMLAFPDNSICFLDLGMFGSFSEEQRKKMLDIFIYMIRGEIPSFLGRLIMFAETSKRSNLPEFEKAARDIYAGWQGTLVKDYSLALAFFRIISMGARYNVIFPPNLIMFAKVLMTTDMIVQNLDPDFNFSVAARPFADRIFTQRMLTEGLLGLVEEGSSLYLQLLERFLNVGMVTLEKLLKGAAPAKENR
jgi:ubiquinone biosynthesis protein